MKKIIPVLIILAALAAIVLVLRNRVGVPRQRATELAPAETIFFAHLPDLRRTAERWQHTALHAIWQEPEVQAFLEKPRTRAPMLAEWVSRFERLRRIAPGEVFVALTSIDAPEPRYVGGFSYLGSRSEVESLVAEPMAKLKSAWPAGQADLVNYGAAEIETFSYEGKVVAQAFRDRWFFASNDLALLKATLDRLDGKGGPALASSETFKNTIAALPEATDGMMFAQLTSLSERLSSLLVASGQAADAKQLDELKRTQAVAIGTKMEGTQIRDTLFLLQPGSVKEAPLPLNTLALSTPETMLFAAMTTPASLAVPESAAPLAMLLPALAATEKALASRGLKLADFGKAFGPEIGALMDWPLQALQPSGAIALGVRDPAIARSFTEAMTSGEVSIPAWTQTDENGMTIFQMPSQGLSLATPILGLNEKFLVLGFSRETLLEGFQRLEGKAPGISESDGYRASSKAVAQPTSSFAYLDLKTLFERAYSMLRPVVAMSVALSPNSGQYIDAGKLPSTDAISKHLGPTVFSQKVTEHGTLAESVGSLTFSQVLVAALGGSAVAALPAIEEAIAGGFKFDQALLPSFSTAAPAPPPTQGPPTPPASVDPAPSQTPTVPPLDAPTPATEQTLEKP